MTTPTEALAELRRIADEWHAAEDNAKEHGVVQPWDKDTQR
jgi:hypothetical protein